MDKAEEILDEILKDDSAKDSSKILAYLRVMHADLKEVKQDHATTKTRLEPLVVKVATLEDQVTVLQAELHDIKKAHRENNLIIFNVSDTTQFNKDIRNKTLAILRKVDPCFVDSCIVNIYRLGRKPGQRPIFIRFNSGYYKQVLYNNTDKLQELEITFSDDLIIEEREERKAARQFIFKLRADGHDPKMRGNKILWNKQLFTLGEIREKLLSQEAVPDRVPEAGIHQVKSSSVDTHDPPTSNNGNLSLQQAPKPQVLNEKIKTKKGKKPATVATGTRRSERTRTSKSVVSRRLNFDEADSATKIDKYFTTPASSQPTADGQQSSVKK